ncbi:MAG: glycosyltransferase [Crocinitomicaceae bacterium]|nr:glycosyltransferase [Crocinitomicaceae bacterium]
MKVVIISSTASCELSPFIQEQIDSLRLIGINCVLFPITQKGFFGYIKHIKLLKKFIRLEKPDLIHAHYGLSGLLANTQRKIPVITTFHGSDINNKKIRWISSIAARLSKHSIYVTEHLKILAGNKKGLVIPCGVDLSIFNPEDMEAAKQKMKLDSSKNYVLFCSSFDNPVKNSQLAKDAFNATKKRLSMNLELLELKQFSREEVSSLLNASYCLLMTSFSEGSPQVIKEALATNRPIVSTAVGSVEELINEVEGCSLVEPQLESVINGLEKCILYSIQNGATQGRKRIQSNLLGLQQIAASIHSIYRKTLNTKSFT